MDSSKSPSSFFKRSRIQLCYTVYLLILCALLVAGAEFVLRRQGVQPWRTDDVGVKVQPGGKFFRKHPTLGYAPLPGQFTVTLGTGCSFRVTHLPNGLRATHPPVVCEDCGRKPEIWVFGCSFTHGWSLDDEQTYPWRLQERMPEHEIVNFGFSGYGTIHSLIQFREALESRTPPEAAVIVYADIHDERNTFLRTRRKAIAPWNRLGPLVQPYASLDSSGKLQYFLADVEYVEFPLMRRLAFAHFVELQWNKIEQKLRQSRKVSEALVVEMARTAQAHGVRFAVATIGKDEKMLEFAQRSGIPCVDISVDFRANFRYMNLPCDGHPSALATKEYAEKLEKFLRKKLLRQNGAASRSGLGR